MTAGKQGKALRIILDTKITKIIRHLLGAKYIPV